MSAREIVVALVAAITGAVLGVRFATATPDTVLPACMCGHSASTHEHYRPGTDCGACGPTDCPGYEPVSEYELTAAAKAVTIAEYEQAASSDLLGVLR